MVRFDGEKLHALLKDFYLVTGIKACVFDADRQEIAFYPERCCAFCGLIRESEAGGRACLESDARAFEVCAERGGVYVYRCHLGLTECVFPLKHGGNIIGYVMIGQAGTEELTFAEVAPAVRRCGVDPVRAEACFRSVNRLPGEKLTAVAHLLEALAGSLYLSKLYEVESTHLQQRIDRFLTEHLTEDLSVGRLCGEFGVSRAELYQWFERFFHGTVAHEVKRRRLEEACRLLTSSRLPVSEIAARCALYDYNYFSKLFKKAIGMSPSAYRRAGRTSGL